MKSWINRNDLHKNIVSNMLAAKESGQEAPVLPDDVLQWLAQLTLLYGVPTTYLTPDVRMLPEESMRFFYLDRNWLDRMVDGAMSVGVLSTLTNVFNETFFEEIYAQVDVAQAKLRAQLKGNSSAGTATVGGPITGVLFRSQVVAGWPGLEVEASKQGDPVSLMRMDRLAPSLLLCLFNGVPDEVSFQEPSEGLHFGVTLDNDPTQFTVSLRGIGYPTAEKYEAGDQIIIDRVPLTAAGKLRSGNGYGGVLDIEDLQQNIAKQMFDNGALPANEIAPGAFAIQMVQGAGKQIYAIDDSKPYPKCPVES